ncbi:MAG: arylsulfatase [Planctomycetota bacterium]
MRSALSGVLFVGLSAVGALVEGAPRPNIILIMLDDMGYSDIGCFGGEIETPHIDQLAAEGVRFRQFYNGAKCESTRHMVMSGRHWDNVQPLNRTGWPTLAQVLGSAGYRTMASGKWHIVGVNPMPAGFDRYFGHLSGASDFFRGNTSFRLDEKPFEVPQEGFYTTDAMTDYAMEFVEEARRDHASKPFFLYLAYNAPHSPLQAPPEDIAKYRGRYRRGWDVVRRERFRRQQESGIADSSWELPTRPEGIPAWETLSDEERDFEDHRMAVYAAMIDRVDQNVGRLMAQLDRLGAADNTLILLHSDNGASPYDRLRRGVLGETGSHWNTGIAWANASNTPFRLYKRNGHQGGSCTPLVARWPAATRRGEIDDTALHVIDLMPTFAELAGAEYPESFAGRPTLPLPGRSFAKRFANEALPERGEPIFFQFMNHKALVDGPWKLVRAFGGPWELYRTDADRTETNNLASARPKRVAAMAARWRAMAGGMLSKRRPGKDDPTGPPAFITAGEKPNDLTSNGPRPRRQ